MNENQIPDTSLETTVVKRCPKCGNSEFLVTAHVTQDWVVGEDGEFIECVTDCVEVTHKPDDDDIWACKHCNYEDEGRKFNKIVPRTTV